MKNDIQKAFGTTTGRFDIQKETNTGPGNIIIKVPIILRLIQLYTLKKDWEMGKSGYQECLWQ
jgi:hypothetical protein